MPLGFDPTPSALFADGRFQVGTFRSAVPHINPLDASPLHLRPLSWLALREWQAFQAGDADCFIVGAVYSSKRVDLLQLIVVDKASARMHKWEEKVPPWKLRVAQGLAGTTSSGEARGLSVRFENDLPRGSLRVLASFTPQVGKGNPAASLEVRGHPVAERSGHLVICHPFPDGRPLYSHKCMMPAEGTFSIGGVATTLSPASAFMILDDHKGFYPSPMIYDWVTGTSRTDGGDVVGLNLTNNQVRDPGRYNENALFRGARVDRLPAVRFDRPGGVMAPWHVSDAEGRVDVRFRPVVRNEVSVGPGGWLADYHGPFGWLEGYVVDDDGARVPVDGMFGMGEKKWIRL